MSMRRPVRITIIVMLAVVAVVAVEFWLIPTPAPLWYDVEKVAAGVTAIGIILWQIIRMRKTQRSAT